MAISSYSQSEDNPKKDLAKFDYKQNMKLQKLNILLFYFGYLLEPFIKIQPKKLIFWHDYDY